MKGLLFINAGIFVIPAVVSFLKGDTAFIINIIGITGLIFVVTAGILTGTFVSGDREKVTYRTEDKERKKKNKLSKNFFFVGLINIAISYLLTN